MHAALSQLLQSDPCSSDEKEETMPAYHIYCSLKEDDIISGCDNKLSCEAKTEVSTIPIQCTVEEEEESNDG